MKRKAKKKPVERVVRWPDERPSYLEFIGQVFQQNELRMTQNIIRALCDQIEFHVKWKSKP